MTLVTLPVVRVLRVDGDQPAAVLERLEGDLPPRERTGTATARTARAACRQILGALLGEAPAAVPISRRCSHCGHESHGRPTVPAAAVAFSVSHSGTRALVAVVPAAVALGVDIELVRPRTRLEALARRALGPDELAAWEASDDRLRTFLHAWTAKEAYLKATGVGVTTALRAVPIRPPGWTADALAVGPDAIAAIAVAAPGARVALEDWEPRVSASGGTAG